MSEKFLKKNKLLSELSDACQKYPRAEKILISPDYQTGNQILESLTRCGTPWINFHVTTVASLAMDLAEEAIISKNLRMLSQGGIQIVVDSIFNDLSDSKELKYFEKHPINKGIIEALAKTISELRLNRVCADNIKSDSFLSPLKEKDIKLLLCAYEKTLDERRLADKVTLITLAMESLKGIAERLVLSERKRVEGKERKYFMPSSYCLSGMEREFLEALCEEDLIVLAEDPVYGIDRPADCWAQKNQENPPVVGADIERLKWLFASGESPQAFKDGTIDIFSALGYRNEIREAARRIIVGKITVDDTEVIYTNRANYADLIYSLCEKLQIPVTFAEGLPGHITGAGRALMAFLLWMKRDFGEIYLRHAIDSGGLKWDSLNNETAGSTTLSYLLRSSGIGWGRDRYSLVLSKKIEEGKRMVGKLREEGEESAALYQEDKIRNLTALRGLCESLFEKLPLKDKDGAIEFHKLCKGCVSFLQEHINIANETDAVFVSAAKEQFTMLETLIESKMSLEEAMSKLINIVSGIRIKASGPKPGHLHVSSYRSGGKSGRGNTFIVGLDEGKFPEKITQDPVLLDDERKKISEGLEVSESRMARNIYSMTQLISGLRGKLTASYSSFDIKEGKSSFPSSLVLQIFRIKENDPKADYNALFNALGDPVGFGGTPDSGIGLDEIDWWIGHLTEKSVLKECMAAVKEYYEGIEDGVKAEEHRSSNVFTEYDGKVTGADHELDPRLNKKMVTSATRLEAAARCPFSYFLENVLGVRKPEEMEKEAFVWLDALARGSLLHEVFQKFIDALKGEKGTVDLQKEKAWMEGILDGIVKQYKEDIVPPSEGVFQNEYLQLKRDIGVFLRINQELQTESVACEAVFGSEGKDLVAIPLGEGKSILLKGKIDRIEKAGPLEYHVWDYKTGSSYAYEENGYVAGGEQLQHGLYAVAAEEILKKMINDPKVKVTKSGYILPTEKGIKAGKGGLFERATDKKEVWQAALNKLLDLIGRGNFIHATKDVCRFCDYADVCNQEAARARMKLKLRNPDNKELQPWLELKEMR